MQPEQNFAILVINPNQYDHSPAFTEVALTLQSGLHSMGYEAVITHQPIEKHRHIVLGANLIFIQKEKRFTLPQGSIIYNLEQIDFASPWFNASLLSHFQNYNVWDYSPSNIQTLKTFNINHVQHLPIGFANVLNQIPQQSFIEQDIDVLFYGSLTQRRKQIIHKLENRGWKVKALFNVYGKERDEWINRSKVILNIHQFEAQVFEIVRVSYLLANQKFVISEVSQPDSETHYFQEGLVFADYDKLVETCETWLTKDQQARDLIAEKGLELIKKRPIEQLLQPLINDLSPPADTQSMDELFRVDLGCGPRKAPGYFGVDICPAPGVDLVANLNQSFPFDDSSIDELRAHDVIEHLPDRLHTMNEIWRICKPGALVDLLVPSSDGRGAFQDPTHISFWNINSFQYFAIEYPGYLDLCQQYGFKGAFKLIALKEYELPNHVMHVHAVLEVIKEDAEDSFTSTPINLDKQLQAQNFIVFPDWTHPEEQLLPALRTVIHQFSLSPKASQSALLIDVSQIPEGTIDPDAFFYEIFMNLLLEEGLDASETSISFLSMSDYVVWDEIKPRLTARLNSGLDNGKILSVLRIKDLPEVPLEFFEH